MYLSPAYVLFLCFVSWLNPHSPRRLLEIQSVAFDIASTDGTVEEQFSLASIAMHESNVHPDAVGKLGERGAFQIMPPNNPLAQGALNLLRRDGWQSYAGCKKPCPLTVRALRAYEP